ncbi:hypothetical protein [Nocardia asteroides]|uniref:hypothetical protein n=1 Tax=Nocardia asteroides TaxID=1824 RepID=UPI0036551547
MSAYREPTRDELVLAFERSLQLALGGMIRTCTPLDSSTLAALRNLAREFPTAGVESVQAARDAFAGQLAGTNVDDGLPEFMR